MLDNDLPVDVVNKLGECEGYDEITCWNQDTKEFASELPELPENSYAFMYKGDDIGYSYTSCAIMESGFLTTLEDGACSGSANGGVSRGGEKENTNPYFSGINLPVGDAGFEYIGYIEALDAENDNLTWSINTNAIDRNAWSEDIILEDTNIAHQKKIYSSVTGSMGVHEILMSLSDGQGGTASQVYIITTKNGNIPVISQIVDNFNDDILYDEGDPALELSEVIGSNLDLIIKAQEVDKQYPLSFTVTGLPNGLNGALMENRHDYRISGVLDDITKEYSIGIIACDSYRGESLPINFKILIINNPPEITSNSLATATTCLDYTETIDSFDTDGHNITYFEANGLPNNLSMLDDVISGVPQSIGQYQVEINIKDQFFSKTISPYSAQHSKTLTLDIVDEVFSVNQISDDTIYVYPNNAILPLYYGPVQFSDQASVLGTTNSMTYSLENNPVWLAIDSHTGIIQGTPTDNINDLGVYDVTVKALNDCGAYANASFSITVLPNEWSGDGTCQDREVCDINADCGVCCNDVIKYQHPSKTCTNGYDSCTTPNLPDTYSPYPEDNGGGINYGCYFGHGYIMPYPLCGPSFAQRNQYCCDGWPPNCTDLPQGTFDYAKGRHDGFHEAALICYPENIEITVCE